MAVEVRPELLDESSDMGLELETQPGFPSFAFVVPHLFKCLDENLGLCSRRHGKPPFRWQIGARIEIGARTAATSSRGVLA